MKITCMQRELNSALSLVRRNVPSNTVLPSITNVLMNLHGNRMKLTTTNLTTTITTTITTAGDPVEGRICLPARLFSELVAGLQHEMIDIEWNDNDTEVRIQAGESTGKLIGINPSDFPPMPEIEEKISAEMDGATFRQAVNRVIVAAATEESRPVLTGISMIFDDTFVTMAAADGFRLAVQRHYLSRATEHPVSIIVPAAAVREVQRQAAADDASVGIGLTEDARQIRFSLKKDGEVNTEFVVQLIMGKFPEYDQLIPAEHQMSVELDAREFNQAVKNSALFSRELHGVVQIQVEEDSQQDPGNNEAKQGNMKVYGTGSEAGEFTEVITSSKIEGSGMIAFNSKYLTDALSSMEHSSVVLETNNSSSPGKLRLANDDSYVYVIMPVFVA